MSDRFASLHRILKDEMPRNILLMFNEKGTMSYRALMKTFGFLTTAF